jgi:hypothetical protein
MLQLTLTGEILEGKVLLTTKRKELYKDLRIKLDTLNRTKKELIQNYIDTTKSIDTLLRRRK